MSQSNINLTQVKFLEELPVAEGERLLGISELRAYSDGEVVFTQEEKLPGVFVVSKGTLKIFRTTGKEKIQILDLLAPGQCIGEAQVFSDSPAIANAEARGATECWIIPASALRQSIKERTNVCEAMLKHLSRKIIHLVPLVETLSLHSVPERVAQLILDHLTKTPDKNFVEFVQTQEELAQYIGASREAFNRGLRLLSDLSIIQSTFPVVRVTDLNKLMRYSKG